MEKKVIMFIFIAAKPPCDTVISYRSLDATPAAGGRITRRRQPAGDSHLLRLLNGGDEQRPHAGRDHDSSGKAQHDPVQRTGIFFVKQKDDCGPGGGHQRGRPLQRGGLCRGERGIHQGGGAGAAGGQRGAFVHRRETAADRGVRAGL